MQNSISVDVHSLGSSLFTPPRGRFRLSPAIFLLALHATAFAQHPPAANRTALNANYGKLPLSFEANQGQTDPKVRFASRGKGYTLFLTDSAAVLSLSKEDPQAASEKHVGGKHGALNVKTDVIRMELAGESPGVKVAGADEIAGKVNYFIGNDASKWRSNIPTYGEVKYSGVYPGIDLVYYGNQRQLEYDFTVAPGADAKSVRLHFAGADKLALADNGDLTVSAPNGQVAFHKPVVYQMKDGKREPVDGQFMVLGKNDLGFALGSYDHNRELVIDPVLAYSTYLGGSGGDSANGIALDSFGDVYIAGTTYSTDFPVTGGVYQNFSKGGSINPTAFVTELNPQSTGAIYSTYFGGSQGDGATAIAVDGQANAYITGGTCSSDFPTSEGAYQTYDKGLANNSCVAFVAKLNAGGTQMLYSTYLGGSGGDNGGLQGIIQFPGSTFPGMQNSPLGGDRGLSIAVDGSGYAYVIGNAVSTDFPVTAHAFQPKDNSTAPIAFVTKVNTNGTGLVYSTYLGGSGNFSVDYGGSIAVDAAGNAYLAGSTGSTNFPVTPGAFQTTLPGAYAAYVAKMNAAGTALIYATYLGGEFEDFANGIAIDAAGNAYVTGSTTSVHFPITPGAFQTVNQGAAATPYTPGANAFVSKLNSTGTSLIYSTFLGGSDRETTACFADSGSAIAVDTAGNAYVTGAACSLDFPVTADAYLPTNPNPYNSAGFYTRLNATGATLLYSTYLGGGGNVNAVENFVNPSLYADLGDAITVDSSGNAYLAGYTSSSNFPVAGNPLQTTNKSYSTGENNSGWVNGFVTEFVAQSPSTTSLVSSSNPDLPDLIVTFTISVAPVKGVVVPTGDVYVYVDGVNPVLVTLDATGKATFSTNELTAGQHQILAIYTGDENYSLSEATLTETIDATSPTVTTLTSSPNPSLDGHPVVFTASVAAKFGPVPTGTVDFYHDATVIGTATLSGGVASVSYSGLDVGVKHPITAKYLGSATDTASVSTVHGQTVEYATTTTVSCTPNPVVYQSPVVCTAHVQASGGAAPTATVTFYHADTVFGIETLSGGTATVTYSGLILGLRSITAIYSGSASDAPSTSPSFGESVELVTNTALKSSLNPSTSGTQVTLTATVTVAAGQPHPTGTVTFMNGTASIGTATLSGGIASLKITSLPVENLPITAVYGGSADDMPSTSPVLTQHVNQ